MIIFRFSSSQIVIQRNEFAISLERGISPTGKETETLAIYTPSRKYAVEGIDSGCLEGYEVLNRILDYINDNLDKPVISIRVDELCGAKLYYETIVDTLVVT